MLIATRIQQPTFELPLWITKTLPDAAWGDAYSARLEAKNARDYKTIAGALPPGLTLRGNRISGSPSPAPDAPKWVTPAGSLGEFGEGESLNLSLAATGVSVYSILGGRFPWGAILNSTGGAISGALANIGGEILDPEAEILWTAPATTQLGRFPRGAALSIPQSATPATRFWIACGSLPWGLTLDPESGTLSGTLNPINRPGVHEFTVSARGAGSFGQRLYSITIL